MSAFALGAIAAFLAGSGVAVAANVSLVRVVNAVLPVEVVNAPPERTPFQWYGEVTAATVIAEPEDGELLVITHVNADSVIGGTFVTVQVGHPERQTARFYWDFTGYLNESTLIYADAGTTVTVIEAGPQDPFVAITGYWETL